MINGISCPNCGERTPNISHAELVSTPKVGYDNSVFANCFQCKTLIISADIMRDNPKVLVEEIVRKEYGTILKEPKLVTIFKGELNEYIAKFWQSVFIIKH
jgi:hypothetical protein